jgi:putative spermidine/putrescine transport system ATP-binding protein
MTEPRLRLEHIGKNWGKFVALADISLEGPRGIFLSLLGPSGCGKTTLLRVITGTISPDTGQVLVDGENVTQLPTYRRNMGMVFQSFALFPHLTVADNVAFPLRVRGLSRREQQERVASALRMVHLDALAERYPRELSGGQQQRVGLARAIVYHPTILLLDEPLSNLDTSLREEMRLEISQVTRQLGITAVYVTHDQREALALSDGIAVMNHGRVVQFGTPEEIYRHPVNGFVASFVGYANAVPIIVADGRAHMEADGAVLNFNAMGLHGPATAFIHASAVILGPCDAGGKNRFSCTVVDLAFMGDHVEYLLQHSARLHIKAHAQIGAATYGRGTRVSVMLPSDKLILVPRGDDDMTAAAMGYRLHG